MKINPKLRMPLAWLWSIDTAFYALAYPVIICAVNRQLNVTMYAPPALIYCLAGSLLSMHITASHVRAWLYDRCSTLITAVDAGIWIGYFLLWIFKAIPDSWYPVATSVMAVTTCQFSNAVRQEYKSRIFRDSVQLTEFNAAVDILRQLMNGVMSAVLLFAEISFGTAQYIMLLAMVIDNGIFLWIRCKTA